MSKAHFIVPTGPSGDVTTVRLGASNAAADNLTLSDAGKLVKLVGESRFDLCVVGDAIEGLILSIEQATAGGFSVGSLLEEPEHFFATADGLQATPGVGAIAVGDFVVAGTITAKGTALTAYPKVCKATVQPGVAVVAADNLVATINAALVTVAAQTAYTMHACRVVSLGQAGTGAVGTTIVVQPLN